MTYGNVADPYPDQLRIANDRIADQDRLIAHLRIARGDLLEANRGMVERILALEADIAKVRAERDRYYAEAAEACQRAQGSQLAGKAGLAAPSWTENGLAAPRPPQGRETAS